MEAGFFENSRIIGIRSSLPGYSLCAHLNKKIGLDFKRYNECDVEVDFPAMKNKSASFNLFETVTETNTEKIIYPVFRHLDAVNENSMMLLFTNKSLGFPLLQDVRWADYLLLLKTENYDEILENIVSYLQTITVVDWLKELNLDALKTKKFLII